MRQPFLFELFIVEMSYFEHIAESIKWLRLKSQDRLKVNKLFVFISWKWLLIVLQIANDLNRFLFQNKNFKKEYNFVYNLFEWANQWVKNASE